MKRFSFLFIVLMFVMTASLQAQDNTLQMRIAADPVSLDPHAQTGFTFTGVAFHIYDTLVYQDDTGAILPSLAESYSVSDDGLQITFDLRDGILFSDGSPFNADAVIFTFERAMQIGQRSQIYGNLQVIDRFEKVDDNTVIFHLRVPSAELLSRLALYGGILSPSAVAEAGDNYGLQPVGTGPFMVTNWVPQSAITLERNPYYQGHRPWTQGTPPTIDTMTLSLITDEATVANAMQANELDMAQITAMYIAEPLNKNPNFKSLQGIGRGVYYLGFNVERTPFDNVNVRRALSMAVDRELINLIAMNGAGMVMHSALTPTLIGYSAELAATDITYDPQTARDLLAAEGYNAANPLRFEILTSTTPTSEITATALQQLWAQIGVETTITLADRFGIRNIQAAGEFDVTVGYYSSNDPGILAQFFGTGSLQSYTRWSHEAFDALMAQGNATYDTEERAAIYIEAQRILQSELPMLPLFAPMVQQIYNSRLHNVDYLGAPGYIIMEDITFGS